MKRTSYAPAIFMAALLGVIAWVRLYVQNACVLFQFQEQQLFLPGWEFFRQTIVQSGGLFTWIGLYLQQYLYYPSVGVSLLIIIWLMGYFASVFAFRLKGFLSVFAILPVSGLMSTLLCTGYWIYVLRVPEYAFTPSLMYMTAMVILLMVRRIRWSWVWQSVICMSFLLYGIIWVRNSLVPEGLRPAFFFAFVSVCPLLILSLFEKQMQKLQERKVMLATSVSFVSVIVATLFLVFYTNVNTFKSDAYTTEMQMSRAIEEGRWQDALDYADVVKSGTVASKATRQIWLMRQVALMNLDRMGDELFDYNNYTALPKATAGVKVHMVEVGGPLLYFMNGRTHFAYRWCMENMVEYGPSVARLRLMAMCTIVNGEDEVARKYLRLLAQTKYYKKWALKQMELLDNRDLIAESEPYRMCYGFQSALTNVTDGDNGLCELFLVVSYAGRKNVSDPELNELCLNYSMIQMNPNNFWMQFKRYLEFNEGKKIPLFYQQAAVLFSTVEPYSVPAEIDMESLDINDSLRESCEKLLSEVQAGIEKGLTPESLARKYYQEYGHSYYWFFLFCQDNATY